MMLEKKLIKLRIETQLVEEREFVHYPLTVLMSMALGDDVVEGGSTGEQLYAFTRCREATPPDGSASSHPR